MVATLQLKFTAKGAMKRGVPWILDTDVSTDIFWLLRSSFSSTENVTAMQLPLIPMLLPPANQVWGKVMFSQVFVCPQGSLCMTSLPVWLPGLMFLLGGSLSLVPCSFRGPLSRRGLSKGAFCPGRGALSKGVSVGGIPPTGMLSCYEIIFPSILYRNYHRNGQHRFRMSFTESKSHQPKLKTLHPFILFVCGTWVWWQRKTVGPHYLWNLLASIAFGLNKGPSRFKSLVLNFYLIDLFHNLWPCCFLPPSHFDTRSRKFSANHRFILYFDQIGKYVIMAILVQNLMK